MSAETLIEVVGLRDDDLHHIADLDRSEQISRIFRHQNGGLTGLEIDHRDPGWSREGDGEHSVNHQIDYCRSQLEKGAQMLGVFDEGLLIGVALVRPKYRQTMAQLSYLHVSRAYRRHGIAARLFDEAAGIARAAGAATMYVSATPTESALGFYFDQGCELAEEVDPELYAYEPEDIHLTLDL